MIEINRLMPPPDFHVVRGQSWMPHEVEIDEPHPFRPGQIVTVHEWIGLGISAAIVSAVRLFQYYRRQPPIWQVELVGLPGRWYAAGHFRP